MPFVPMFVYFLFVPRFEYVLIFDFNGVFNNQLYAFPNIIVSLKQKDFKSSSLVGMEGSVNCMAFRQSCKCVVPTLAIYSNHKI